MLGSPPTYNKIYMTETMSCNNCTIARMADAGCCTSDVGYGLKIMEEDGRRFSVCKYLEDYGDGYECQIYYDPERFDECKSQRCFN